VRWAGTDFKKAGLVEGAGEWRLTALGRTHLESRQGENILWPKVMPLDPQLAGQIHSPLETVDVTDYAGYEIPTLRLREKASLKKKQLMLGLERRRHPCARLLARLRPRSARAGYGRAAFEQRAARRGPAPGPHPQSTARRAADCSR
jgi:hypothetical protein